MSVTVSIKMESMATMELFVDKAKERFKELDLVPRTKFVTGLLKVILYPIEFERIKKVICVRKV